MKNEIPSTLSGNAIPKYQRMIDMLNKATEAPQIETDCDGLKVIEFKGGEGVICKALYMIDGRNEMVRIDLPNEEKPLIYLKEENSKNEFFEFWRDNILDAISLKETVN